MPLLLLILVLVGEAVVFSIWLDTGALVRARGLAGLVPRYGPLAVRSALVFAVLAPVVSIQRLRSLGLWRSGAIRWRFALLHLAAVGAFTVLSNSLFRTQTAPLAAAWLSIGSVLVGFAMLAVYPGSSWLVLARQLGPGCSILLGLSIATASAGPVFWRAWDGLNDITFLLVAFLLRPLIPNLVIDAAAKTVASAVFDVQIAPQCSGYEGMGLVLAFGAVWLSLNRRDYRFPQALLLLPAGVALIFVLNSLRIAALFLIGHLGAPGIALGGFHSQAGWIAFLLVSVLMAAGSRRLPWIARGSRVEAAKPSPAPDETTAALAPFVAAMAASLLTGAVTAGFDWLYPVRTVAAVAVLWMYRNEYRKLNWTVGLRPILTGAVVFALWIALEPDQVSSAAAPPVWWIIVRAFSATVVIPLIEELAFRHYLQRRLELLFSPALGLAGASLIFGLMHGQWWIAGTIAGLIFGLEYRRQSCIGAAVVSHAVANALVAVYVVATQSWQLW